MLTVVSRGLVMLQTRLKIATIRVQIRVSPSLNLVGPPSLPGTPVNEHQHARVFVNIRSIIDLGTESIESPPLSFSSRKIYN